jgi:hypothetical protein
MRRAFAGAALIVAGIAAFIEASGRSPEYVCGGEPCGPGPLAPGFHPPLASGHVSRTAYDLLRIGAWALGDRGRAAGRHRPDPVLGRAKALAAA